MNRSRLVVPITLLACTWLAPVTVHGAFSEVAARLHNFSVTPIPAPPSSESKSFSASISREYGLQEWTRWAVRPGHATLSVYEMSDTQGAFGFYSIWQRDTRKEATSLQINPDNLRIGNRLATWAGHYFFLIESGEEHILHDLPLQLEQAVQEESLHPLTVLHLPGQNLIPHSIRFYLGPEALKANKDIPEQLINELGFSDEVEACTAQYGPAGETLLLLAYPNPSVADNYGARIQDALQSVIAHDGIYMKRSGPLLGLFLGSLSGAQEVLGTVQYKARVKWVHDPHAEERQAEEDRAEIISFFGVVRSSIFFTGAFILTVMALGLVAGLLRFTAVQKFPALTRRDDTIVLDLGKGSDEKHN